LRGLKRRRVASLLKVASLREREAFMEAMRKRTRLSAEERKVRERERRFGEALASERGRRSGTCPTFLLLLGAEALAKSFLSLREAKGQVEALRAELERACLRYVSRRRRREAIEGRLKALLASWRRALERAVQAEAEQSFISARRAKS